MNNDLDTTPESGACQPGQPVSQAGNDLYARIVDFLKSLPNLSNETMQRAFLFGFDAGFREYIRCGLPLAEFVPLLVATALNYGVLQDGRHALRAVLESAQQSVGTDRRAVCAGLLRELDDYLHTAAASRPEQSVRETNAPPRAASQPQNVQFGNLSFGNITGNVKVAQAGGNIYDES